MLPHYAPVVFSSFMAMASVDFKKKQMKVLTIVALAASLRPFFILVRLP
jgi:hypothetical protein